MNTQAPIPTELYSPDLINLAIFELDRYISSVRDSKARSTPTPLPPTGLAQVFSAMGVKTSSTDELESLKEQLKAFLVKSPTVNIILSAPPTNGVKQQITSWFRQQVSPNILLNFSARADIGGGIILQVGSRIYDFSFKKSLLDNKSRIAELINV
ncbi:MAG TPA: F0F1 ATP synthase subunit delta [Candidatus Saccharimonadales bacterium]|nr:F0F1 ATP synthase subunit delta [Candidatus Saccharimonadales bacterium]